MTPTDQFAVGSPQSRHETERQFVGNFGSLWIKRGFTQADPFDVHGDLALAEQFVRLENVHGSGLGNRWHVLKQAQEVIESFHGQFGIDHTFRVTLGDLGFIPDIAAGLPDHRVNLAC